VSQDDCAPVLARRASTALESLNFFMADMQAGIGPFLGVFLQQRGWTTGSIGLVMTLGGVAGLIVTAPAGALIDATKRKRLYVIGSGLFTVLASSLIWVSQDFWVIAGAQVATAIAGAAIGPAVAGMTLGIAKQRGFNRQNGRNQAFNHAGNVAGAALSGFLGRRFGFVAIFWLAAAFGLASIASVLMIPRTAIDDEAARGLGTGEGQLSRSGRAEGWRVLVASKPLIVLAVCLGLFHLGNAAMLPLYGLALVAAHKGEPASTVAMTIVGAQAVMVGASLMAMTMAEKRGYWLVILITFIALPLRGLVAASVIAGWGVFPVQILDGVGAGFQSVAVPGLVARILSGTGRVNVGQGAVMSAQGLGAAVSPAIGGAMAQAIGFRGAFLVLGAFALGSLSLWLCCRGLLKPACSGPSAHKAARLAHAA
jgi:MFS family permease